MKTTDALADWLFPKASQIHPDWITLWYSPGLVRPDQLRSSTTLSHMLEQRIRRYCTTPQLPRDPHAAAVCRLTDRQRMGIGGRLAEHLCAPVIRRQIAGTCVVALKSVLGAEHYDQVVRTSAEICLPAATGARVHGLIKEELHTACAANKLPSWWHGLAVRLLEQLIGEQNSFVQKRLSLHVPPDIWRNRPLSLSIDKKLLIELSGDAAVETSNTNLRPHE